jgi:hypothetical protein
VPETVHVGDGAIELAERFGRGDVERCALLRLRGLLRGARIKPRLQLARGFLQPDHFGGERRRTLDQRGVRRPRLGHSLRAALDVLARLGEPALRRVEAAFRLVLADRHRGARGTRFRFPPVSSSISSMALRRSVASTSFLRSSRTVSSRDRETCASNETMAFSISCSSAPRTSMASDVSVTSALARASSAPSPVTCSRSVSIRARSS